MLGANLQTFTYFLLNVGYISPLPVGKRKSCRLSIVSLPTKRLSLAWYFKAAYYDVIYVTSMFVEGEHHSRDLSARPCRTLSSDAQLV